MKHFRSLVPFAVLLCALPAAAKDDLPAERLKSAEQIAWTLDSERTEMTISVSPARQTLQIAGSAGLLIGSSISAIQNEKYRKAIEEVLVDYDCSQVFRDKLAGRLDEVLESKLVAANPMGSTAGYNNVQDAKKDRYKGLRADGSDILIDFKMDYGLYGYEGLLVTKLEARVYSLAKGRLEWKETVVASAQDVLANDKLSDPTNSMMPSFSTRLSASEDAISQWTGDGGVLFRGRYEAAVDGCISAMLNAMGLTNEPLGDRYLGMLYLMQKDFDDATAAFQRVLAAEPENISAMNGLSVVYGHDKKVDEAIALATKITEMAPDFGPAEFNLAWWYADEKEDGALAKPHYEKALALGMPEDKKIQKAIGE
ncbi:MAG: tetratricopeptide repeat protein [Candidatus Hydrogenedens sp.]|nr:tetratricopeptide repeat protein [Candidatus Hydrogenedens sp.]